MKQLILSLIFCGVAHTLFAQDDAQWQALKEKYPHDAAIYLNRTYTVNLNFEKDSLRMYTETSADMLSLKEQTDLFSDRRVYGSHFSEVTDLKAKTWVWEKNKYKPIPVTTFKKNSDQDRGVFYDDSYYYTFDYPAAAMHNRVTLQYREIMKDIRFMPGFTFTSYLPQLRTTFIIKAPKEVDIFFQVMNDSSKQIKFSKTEKGKNVQYEWTAENLTALKGEDNSPPVSYYTPHIVCYIKSYTHNGVKHEVLKDISSLSKWYYSHVSKVNANHSEQLQAQVEQLKAKSKTEQELVKNIFYWVQDNVKYIAFEQGMRGFIPNSGSYTCDKRYGDCKDMANLIVDMSKMAGLPVYHTWIGTRDIPYKYSQFPTPIVDNHMIATYISPDGNYTFLDATSNYTPMGYPSSMIQGKEAFIVKEENDYMIRGVPELDMNRSLMTDSVSIRLENAEVFGTGTVLLNGYAKVYGGYELDRAKEKDIKESVTRITNKGNNKYLVGKYQLTNQLVRDLPTVIQYDFKISNYYQQVGNEIYFNLNLNKEYFNTYINKNTRKTPRENSYKYVKRDVVELEIPAGYEIEFIPENARVNGKHILLSTSYKVQGNKIQFVKEIGVNYLLLQPAEFNTWNDEVKKISEIYKQSIIFKKK
ncbi:MAG: transglutaminase-like domain-containing protein [Cyclobacteriaceae bacterium]|jgi:transglutaminase-like putative cysteine protease